MLSSGTPIREVGDGGGSGRRKEVVTEDNDSSGDKGLPGDTSALLDPGEMRQIGRAHV